MGASDYCFCQSGDRVGGWMLYNPVIVNSPVPRPSMLHLILASCALFQHHVWLSEVLWLERPVSQPGHQFPGQS